MRSQLVAVLVGGALLAAACSSSGGAGDSSRSSQPGAASSPPKTAAASSTTRPLNGGSYVWPDGIKLTLKIVKQQLWTKSEDLCGDGSCGVIRKGVDLEVVLRYTVSVPADFKGPFDPYGCNNDLHAVNGNDMHLLIPFGGPPTSEIDGKILPGATKYGQTDYSIDHTLLGQEFVVESMCDENGEYVTNAATAYFRGVINRP